MGNNLKAAGIILFIPTILGVVVAASYFLNYHAGLVIPPQGVSVEIRPFSWLDECPNNIPADWFHSRMYNNDNPYSKWPFYDIYYTRRDLMCVRYFRASP